MKKYKFYDGEYDVCEHIEELARLLKRTKLEFGDCDGDYVTVTCLEHNCWYIHIEELIDMVDN